MKILHVITSLRPGGAEKLISDIVPRLCDKGHEVDVLVFDGVDTDFKKVLQNKGIKVYSFSVNCYVYNPLFVYKLAKILRKYNIVHTHNTAPQLFVAIASFASSVKLVTTEHSTSNRRRNSDMFKFIDRWMYNRYDTVICISEMTKNNLVSYLGETKANIITIYNGIDVQSYAKAKAIEKNTDKVVITMVAGFRYQKDHETVIRALSHLDTSRYVLWLVGDGDRRKIIEDYIKKYNMQDYVLLWGIRSDIPAILKASDIILQSSHIEGFGLAAVEGMAAGKPVVATDIPGLGQIVNGAGVLFRHKDERALASAIELLTTNRDYYIQVASACQERAMMFDIRKMVDKYNEIYEDVVS